MVPRSAVFRTLFRNLGWAGLALAALCWGLGTVEILQFLKAVPEPALAGSGICWALYALLRVWEETRPMARVLCSAQGPGGELVQKATLHAFREQQSYRAGQEEETHFLRGEQRFGDCRFADAARHYQQSLELRPALPVCLNLSAALINAAQFDQAGEMLLLGLQQARHQERRDYEAAFQGNLGILGLHQGRLEAGRQAAEEALDLFTKIKDRRGEADALLVLGSIHARRGEWEEAARLYRAVLKTYEDIDHPLGRANVLADLGNARLHQEEYDEALMHYRAALTLHEGQGNPLGKANALTNIGVAHFRRGQLDEARRTYEAALELHRQIGALAGEAGAQTNIGTVFFRQGKLEEALRCFQAALKIHQETGDALGRATTLTNLGSLFARQHRFQEALEPLEQARILYLEAGARGRGLEAVEKLIARLRRRLARSSAKGKP
ncbi:MAG: tetratricopeptide repeat protein [Candidatus Latescibacteria bacterium]|nr:tetratricopeptide repeat protein [Candidatus Latescibacterota bacterium]